MMTTGTRNASVPAAMADHSMPPRPSMVAIEGGAGLLLAIPLTALVVGLVIWFQRRFERR